MDNSTTVAKQLAGKAGSTSNRTTTASVVLSIKGEIMKKWIFSAVVTGCLLGLMIAVPVQAQLPGARIRAAIPFDFIVRGKTLPAGNYEIERINNSPDGLMVRNVNEKRDEAVFETEPVEPRQVPNRSEIIFHRYGDTYFLSEVLTAGEETAQQVIPSRSERLLRRETMASNRTQPTQTVAVVVD
jgi:hypothetical protein